MHLLTTGRHPQPRSSRPRHCPGTAVALAHHHFSGAVTIVPVLNFKRLALTFRVDSCDIRIGRRVARTVLVRILGERWSLHVPSEANIESATGSIVTSALIIVRVLLVHRCAGDVEIVQTCVLFVLTDVHAHSYLVLAGKGVDRTER